MSASVIDTKQNWNFSVDKNSDRARLSIALFLTLAFYAATGILIIVSTNHQVQHVKLTIPITLTNNTLNDNSLHKSNNEQVQKTVTPFISKNPNTASEPIVNDRLEKNVEPMHISNNFNSVESIPLESGISPNQNEHSVPTVPDSPVKQDSNQQSKSDSTSYASVVRKMIEAKKEYPSLARRFQMEGSVTISFKLSETGAIIESSITQVSGHKLLDQAALRALLSVHQFPAPSAGVNRNFQVSLTFKLSDS